LRSITIGLRSHNKKIKVALRGRREQLALFLRQGREGDGNKKFAERERKMTTGNCKCFEFGVSY